jgi:hypothetical protein
MDRSPRMAQRIREVAEKRVGAESPGGEIAPDIAQRGGASRQS